MRNRIQTIDTIKQNLFFAGISNECVDKLFQLFADLEHLVIIGRADNEVVESFLKGIVYLMADISDEHSIAMIKEIRELARNYTRLFPLLMQICHKAKRDADQDNLKEQNENQRVIQFLKEVLIKPMLFKMAESTENYYISKYFGKIPIVSMHGQTDIHATTELSKIDLYLEENMQLIKRLSGQLSALQPYVLTFSHLNKYNEKLLTASTGKLLFHYLNEWVTANQDAAATNDRPKLLFASKEIIHIFQPNISANHDVCSATDDNTIFISIDKHIYFDKIARSLIHEIQHLYNAYFLSNDNQSSYLSNAALNQFIRFTDILGFENKIHQTIVKDLQKILKEITRCKQKDHDLNELSAQLTSLLFKYPDSYIRGVINIIVMNCTEMPDKVTNNNEVLLVCKTLSNAFTHIEHTIQHLAIAITSFNINKITEFFDSDFKDHSVIIRNIAKQLPRHSLQDICWDEIIKTNFNICNSAEELVAAASLVNPAYYLHEQAGSGNNNMVRNLLAINSTNINKVDKGGYSPLAYALIRNHESTFNLLLQFGASAKWEGSLCNKKNFNLLHVAANYGIFKFIPILLNYGVSTEALNQFKCTPLLTAIYFIMTNSVQDYNASITALAYLLSYSHSQDIQPKGDLGLVFYDSLIQFRKNIAILYTLHSSGALRLDGINMPDDIIRSIALQFTDDVPNQAYQNCYRDIMIELLTNKNLFSKFINLGMQSAYNEFQIVIQNSMHPFDAIKKVFVELIAFDKLSKNNSSTTTMLSQEKRKQLSHYYSPRSLYSGAVSLSAVTFAQRQMRVNSTKKFFQEDNYNERRFVIQEWKKKAERKADAGLALAIVQACKEMGITEIDNPIYHKLAAILKKLVIDDNRTPRNYTPQLFAREVKRRHQETVASREVPTLAPSVI